LKQQLKEMKNALEAKEQELLTLKKNVKYTKVQEAEVLLSTYPL